MRMRSPLVCNMYCELFIYLPEATRGRSERTSGRKDHYLTVAAILPDSCKRERGRMVCAGGWLLGQWSESR